MPAAASTPARPHYRRLVVSSAVALLVFLLPFGLRDPATHLLVSWDAFALSTLVQCWVSFLRTDQRHIRAKARQQDFGSKLIFVFTTVASCASMGAVIYLMRAAKSSGHLGAHITLSLATVLAAWLLLHTVFALHYAHTYYGDSRAGGKTEHEGGLDFPGDEPPDYRDFAYFSFVIGMTYQVSDVPITSRRIRHIALLHSLIAFAFYTLIIAFAINTVSSLAQ